MNDRDSTPGHFLDETPAGSWRNQIDPGQPWLKLKDGRITA